MNIFLSRRNKGFTLIELLVVIGIIGVLTAIVLPNLISPRAKSRDGKRVADIKQIQLALELYADRNSGKFPATDSAGLSAALTPTYIQTLPKDPTTGANYQYIPRGSSSSLCYGYHLGAALEEGTNTALREDADSAVSVGGFCGQSVSDFEGTSATASNLCDSTAGVAQGQSNPTEKCYDVVNN